MVATDGAKKVLCGSEIGGGFLRSCGSLSWTRPFQPNSGVSAGSPKFPVFSVWEEARGAGGCSLGEGFADGAIGGSDTENRK